MDYLGCIIYVSMPKDAAGGATVAPVIRREREKAGAHLAIRLRLAATGRHPLIKD